MAALMAHVPAIPRVVLPGVQNQLNLDEIILAPDAGNPAATQLAAMRAGGQRGDLDAQTQLGIMYYRGMGVPLDWGEAQVWFRLAAQQGGAEAQVKLGVMCFMGQGMPRDIQESMKWFRKAAKQGQTSAQVCVGAMYAEGVGVSRDLVEAYTWLLQALAGGDANAAEPCRAVQNLLSPRQIQEGRRRAMEAIQIREKVQKRVGE
jgi:TPR repeat protein